MITMSIKTLHYDQNYILFHCILYFIVFYYYISQVLPQSLYSMLLTLFNRTLLTGVVYFDILIWTNV